jgi:hypothetical protein
MNSILLYCGHNVGYNIFPWHFVAGPMRTHSARQEGIGYGQEYSACKLLLGRQRTSCTSTHNTSKDTWKDCLTRFSSSGFFFKQLSCRYWSAWWFLLVIFVRVKNPECYVSWRSIESCRDHSLEGQIYKLLTLSPPPPPGQVTGGAVGHHALDVYRLRPLQEESVRDRLDGPPYVHVRVYYGHHHCYYFHDSLSGHVATEPLWSVLLTTLCLAS